MYQWLAILGLVAAGCAGVSSRVAKTSQDDGGAQPDVGVSDGHLESTTVDFADPLATDGPGSLPDLAGGCGVSQVVINELQTTGATGVKSDEWVELFNPCMTSVDLNGSKLIYRSATATTDGFQLVAFTQAVPAGGYLLAAGASYAGNYDVKFATGGLADTGGAVGLRDAAGNLVDSVGWGSANNIFVEGAAAIAPPNGMSIARKPNGHDTEHNDLDFAVGTPTPKAPN
jgi:hypothetical protein